VVDRACLGPPCLARPEGHSAGSGLALQHNGLTRHDTESHRACIVPGLVGSGQIGLGLGGLFEQLYIR
jgi:hypothetical protein